MFILFNLIGKYLPKIGVRFLLTMVKSLKFCWSDFNNAFSVTVKIFSSFTFIKIYIIQLNLDLLGLFTEHNRFDDVRY